MFRSFKTIFLVILLLISMTYCVCAETLKEKLARDGMFSFATKFTSPSGKKAEIRRDQNGNDQIYVNGKQVTFLQKLEYYFAHGSWGDQKNKYRNRIYDIKWSPDEKKLAITMELVWSSDKGDDYNPTVLVLFLDSLKMVYAGGHQPGYSMDFYAYHPFWINDEQLKFIFWMDGTPFISKTSHRSIRTINLQECQPIVHIPMFEEQNRRAGIKMEWPRGNPPPR